MLNMDHRVPNFNSVKGDELDLHDLRSVEFPPLFICKGGRAFRREDSKKQEQPMELGVAQGQCPWQQSQTRVHCSRMYSEIQNHEKVGRMTTPHDLLRKCALNYISEAYKLPHRLIEKKRRDRINECIAQLKDLLPEHLKLSTLGHLEKAVVLELTLKHVKTLTSLTQQQQERLNVLQKGEQPELDDQTGLQAFRLGYHACAREVLTYLARQERWGACEASSPGLLSHLQRAVTLGLPDGVASSLSVDPRSCTAAEEEEEDGSRRGAGGPHCVPVIRRGALGGGAASGGTEAAGSPHPAAADGAGDATRASSNSDTDSDSGYGGDGGARCAGGGGCREGARVKRERVAGHAPDRRSKKRRFKVEPECRADATAARAAPLGGERGAGCASELATNGPNQPFIVPFYLVHPAAAAAAAAAAAYGPMVEGKAAHGFAPLLDKMPFPLLYSGLPPALAAAALHNMQQQQSLSSIGTPSSPASEDDIE